MASQPTPRVTAEQYLEIERKAEFRSEYLDGQMFAMAGGTLNHAWIAADTLARLNEQLRGRSCGAAGSDVRVLCETFGIYTYPDVVVTCGRPKFQDGHKDTIVDATVIIEVLSPSTKNFDMGEKFRYYRSLASFTEYILLDQDSIRAEHRVRQSDGSWVFREFTSPDAELHLVSIGCQLTLETLYERVEFEPQAKA